MIFIVFGPHIFENGLLDKYKRNDKVFSGFSRKTFTIIGTKYSRMDQVKFVEYNL